MRALTWDYVGARPHNAAVAWHSFDFYFKMLARRYMGAVVCNFHLPKTSPDHYGYSHKS